MRVDLNGNFETELATMGIEPEPMTAEMLRSRFLSFSSFYVVSLSFRFAFASQFLGV